MHLDLSSLGTSGADAQWYVASGQPDLAEPVEIGSTLTPEWANLPTGPDIHLEIRRRDFADIVDELLALEQEQGVSTIEMFRQYVDGARELDDSTFGWLSLYVLYLVTPEVRQFSCP